MRGNKPMDGAVTFRASSEEMDAYDRKWKQLGFKSESDLHRVAGNMLVSGNNEKHNGFIPTALVEINTHLNRIGSALMQLAVVATNDNFPDSPHFAKALEEALSDIKMIRRKIS
jgi:hypothetical protein